MATENKKIDAKLLVPFSLDQLVAEEAIILREEVCPDQNVPSSIEDLAIENELAEYITDTLLGVVSGSKYDELLDKFMEQCGFDHDGNFVKDIYIHPYPLDIPYKISFSRGWSEDPILGDYEIEDVYTVKFGDHEQLIGDVTALTSIEWQGTIFDTEGEPTEEPAVSLVNNFLLFDKQVAGVIRVKYNSRAYKYVLHVPEKPGTLNPQTGYTEKAEKPYESTVLVFWKNSEGDPQVENLEIDTCQSDKCGGGLTNFEVCAQTEDPFEGLTAEQIAAMSPEEIAARNNSARKPPEGVTLCDDVPQEGEVTVQYIPYDFCTGEQIEEFEVYVDGTLVDDPTSHTIPKGTHEIKITSQGYQDTDADDLEFNDTFTV